MKVTGRKNPQVFRKKREKEGRQEKGRMEERRKRRKGNEIRKEGKKEGRKERKEGEKEGRRERKEGKKECKSVFHAEILICSLPPSLPSLNCNFAKVARRKIISFRKKREKEGRQKERKKEKKGRKEEKKECKYFFHAKIMICCLFPV